MSSVLDAVAAVVGPLLAQARAALDRIHSLNGPSHLAGDPGALRAAA
jgi:hypothetical protein